MGTKIEKNKETQHNEMLELLRPLVDFMDANGFNYFITIGREGLASRYMNGDSSELSDMLAAFAENHPSANDLMKSAINQE